MVGIFFPLSFRFYFIFSVYIFSSDSKSFYFKFLSLLNVSFSVLLQLFRMASPFHLYEQAGIHVLFISRVQHAWCDSANEESCRWSRYQDKRVVSNAWLTERQILTSDDNITFFSPPLFSYIAFVHPFTQIGFTFIFTSHFHLSFHFHFHFISSLHFHLTLYMLFNFIYSCCKASIWSSLKVSFATLSLEQSTKKREAEKSMQQQKQQQQTFPTLLILSDSFRKLLITAMQ